MPPCPDIFFNFNNFIIPQTPFSGVIFIVLLNILFYLDRTLDSSLGTEFSLPVCL